MSRRASKRSGQRTRLARRKRFSAVAHGGFDVTKVRPGPEFRAKEGAWPSSLLCPRSRCARRSQRRRQAGVGAELDGRGRLPLTRRDAAAAGAHNGGSTARPSRPEGKRGLASCRALAGAPPLGDTHNSVFAVGLDRMVDVTLAITR
jgi:hypothetical protein